MSLRSQFIVYLWPLALLIGCNGDNANSRRASADVASSKIERVGSRDPKPKLARGPVLEQDQREFLWECEHRGLVLARRGFPQIAKALVAVDAAALADRLADDFTGEIFQQPIEVKTVNDDVQVVRLTDAGKPRAPLTRQEFVQKLIEYRRLFHQPPKAAMALMTFSPLAREDLKGLWQGMCQLRLWGEAEPGQPCEVVLTLQYRVAEPTDAALARPGWMSHCAIQQSLVARAARPLFKEVAAERGIDPKRFHDNWLLKNTQTNTGGVYLCDFNRDGFTDAFVTDLNCYALYQGGPSGKFTDVTSSKGLPTIPMASAAQVLFAAFIDLDNDGWEDLLLSGQIYRNDAGRRFMDVTRKSSLKIPKDIIGVAVADYDRDGLMDLYLFRSGKGKAESWIEGKSGEEKGNLLLRNKGNWQFEDVTAKSGTGGSQRSTFSAVWFDANNDGWPDLHVPNEFGPGVLLINQQNGTFREQLLAEGPSDFGTMGLTAGDIDNDGNIDLYVGNMYSKAGNRVFCNVKPGSYPEETWARIKHFVIGSQLWHNRGASPVPVPDPVPVPVASGRPLALPHFKPRAQEFQVSAVGWAYGPAFADFDNDGFLDLYATAGFVSQNRDEPDG